MDAFEREEQMIEDELACGNLSLQEYNSEMRDLQNSYRESAREAACDAFNEEMDRW